MTPLTQSLANLARKRQLTRSVASVVRAEFAAILAARQAGLSYEQICMGLRELGLEVSARTLRHTVYRIQGEKHADAASGVNTGALSDSVMIFDPTESPPPSRSASPPPGSTLSIPMVEPFRLTREVQPVPPPSAAPDLDVSAGAGASEEAPPRSGRFEPDAIRQIHNSTPDLDLLADRYRRRLAAERTAQRIPQRTADRATQRSPAGPAAEHSAAASPEIALPQTPPPHADQPTT